jgi:hypothetical protein
MPRTKKNNDCVNIVETKKEDTINNVNIDDAKITKPKRGRKPKNELEKEKSKNQENKSDNIECNIEEKNNSFLHENNCINEIMEDIKQNNLNNDKIDDNTTQEILESSDNNSVINDDKPTMKKRGRKPKGGKIVQQIIPINNNKEIKPNIILHLKCSLKDLHNNTLFSSNVESFNFSDNNSNNLSYELINNNNLNYNFSNNYKDDNDNNSIKNKDDNLENDYEYDNDNESVKDCNIKEIWKKLKILEHNLHINNISDKKSACFWDTCEFDNPPIYIPKHYINGTYEVYGCFCSPECAVGHLMNEPIDSSIKFERYHLINFIYGKIYNYTKNIKPATSPYYMLDKYYGNLSIQQYRSLLRNERLFLIVDKPLTRVLPELHEDNDDFIINNKIIPSNTFQIKKKIQRKNQSKNNILNEKFGLTQQ